METEAILSEPDRWQRYRAVRAIAHHAKDAAELARLLDMVGLEAGEGRFPPPRQPRDSGKPGGIAPTPGRRAVSHSVLDILTEVSH